ncbi:putative oxidoreductase CipA [Massarina eburnea CBS 473.64]|uniref:Putative oxidoreductase CipA n=1 Tax=Massarina eburnea CBS 473.64 TaxID=1395130 RepID=A0A6A6SGG6_9PLEO|nr:putative oxidoreductase CipA [Massarina eburnea CBS 473.64]
MAQHIRNVAIVGATGNSGKYMVNALLAKGTFKITAISRAGSAAPPSEVHVATVDYSDPSTLVSALKNQDALIMTMSVTAPGDTTSKLIEAAAKAGVPWILPNEFGGDTDDPVVGTDTFMGPPKIKDRRLIESLGVSNWIAVATGFWYEHSLGGPGLYGINIPKRECVLYDAGEQRIDTSTWPQVGRGVANLLSLPITSEDKNTASLEDYRNRFVFISSFTLNQREMLAAVQHVTKTTDADWKITSMPAKDKYEDGKKRLFAGDRTGFGDLLYSRTFFPGENAMLYSVTKGSDNEKLGLPKEDLEEATRNVSVAHLFVPRLRLTSKVPRKVLCSTP